MKPWLSDPLYGGMLPESAERSWLAAQSPSIVPPVPRAYFRRTNTNVIMATAFEPIKWVVPGYISEGFLVLAGRQKLGKTWLAIDMALAVATGTAAIGTIMCEQGDVLYIDMENGPRRIQSRIATLFPDERNRPDLSRLEWVTEAPQLGAGFVEELERWRVSVPAPRFIIIDVLQRIKPPGTMARNAYENDYSTWAPLQEWATGNGIAVLGLHHTKKGGADDPLEALSGSNGLSACADTTLVLDSDQNGKTLYVRGRDVEEKETALIFAGGFWSILGEAADVRRSDERIQITAALIDHGEPMTPAELSTSTGKPSLNVRQLLFKMAKAGEVHKAGGGRYWVEPQIPSTPRNTDNGGNASVEHIIDDTVELAPPVTSVTAVTGVHSYGLQIVASDGRLFGNGVRLATKEEAQIYADVHVPEEVEDYVTTNIIKFDEPPLNSIVKRRRKFSLTFEHGTCGSLPWRPVEYWPATDLTND